MSLTVSGAEKDAERWEEVDEVPKTCWVDIVRMTLIGIIVLSILLIFLGKAIRGEYKLETVTQDDGRTG